MLSLYLAMIDTDEDRAKFAALYERYSRLMFYIARQILGDEQLSEDAVQEALLRAESAGDARGNGLRARVESAGTRTEILAVYEAAGTATNLIRIDELLSKQAAASVGAVSRRARDLRFGAANGSPAEIILYFRTACWRESGSSAEISATNRKRPRYLTV